MLTMTMVMVMLMMMLLTMMMMLMMMMMMMMMMMLLLLMLLMMMIVIVLLLLLLSLLLLNDRVLLAWTPSRSSARSHGPSPKESFRVWAMGAWAQAEKRLRVQANVLFSLFAVSLNSFLLSTVGAMELCCMRYSLWVGSNSHSYSTLPHSHTPRFPAFCSRSSSQHFWIQLMCFCYDCHDIWTIGGCPFPKMDGRRIAARLQEGYRMPKPTHVDEELWVWILEFRTY